MSYEESIEDRQNNELEALKAIYEDSLFDLRKGLKKSWKPLDIKITLTPLRGSSGLQEINVKLDLHIVCCKNYPNEVPKIAFENVLGISKTALTELKNELFTKSSNLVGEVMIFELAEHVKAFLYKHNKPATKSFYDEMVQRQRLHEQQEKEKEREEVNRKKQVILKEIQERQEILKQENKKLRERRFSTDRNEKLDLNQRRSSSHGRKHTTSNEGSNEVLCEHSKPGFVEFTNNGLKLINCYQCIEHGDNSIKFVGVDQETGQLFIVTEWTISNNLDMGVINKNISSIEHEMNYLVKFKHANLIHYLNMKHEFSEEEKKMKVYILQDFIWGLNLQSLYFYEEMPIELDMVRYLAEGILNALDFLHRNNCVHKNLLPECIYLDKIGTIKISNYSLDKRLADLITQPSSFYYSKKIDIFNFGLLCLSLIKGSINNKNLDIPTHISMEVHDFLQNCLADDEKKRQTAYQLLNHPFLKTPICKLDFHGTTQLLVQKEISPEIKNDNIDLFTQGNNIGQSRFENEFQLLDHLGKGAYGDVYKVQNKLDQQYYAIKRIELNPKSKQLNKKIIREVKLLSRLNHENVVRYFNSWIETAILSSDGKESVSLLSNTTPSLPNNPEKKEFYIEDSFIEKFAPPVKDNIEWSISYGSKSKPKEHVSSSSSSSDSSNDEYEDNFDIFLENLDLSSDSESIEFDHGEASHSTEKTEAENNISTDTVDSAFSFTREIQFMYIQMEFCEKSTLRTAIDDGLYLDIDRMWRLFREIVEGLVHIHQQGMIHRDLKPMNIFLDYNDHVKIGDFGLATTNLLTKNDILSTNKSFYDNEVIRESHEDPSMTGHIGTALYVAPELTSTAKAIYNQKVDIYSLGIIFFEMCYKPLNTGMERINVINGIRKKNIVFPSDFNVEHFSNQEKIIRWLLDHNVSKRPTSQELLQSDYIPPPVLEDCELRELVRHTLSNSQLKAYKYLIDSCFKQTPTQGQDVTYDEAMNTPNLNKNLLYNYTKNIIVKIFEIHGGQNLPTPLLMPKSKYYENVETCVKLMTHSGGIVSIPHDLRVPFARYIARNNITSLRRYSIERVYREKRIFGFIPRELYECAFDIVGPTADFMAEAELIFILNQIVDEIPGLKNKNLRIRINHVLLIKAIFLHCGIKDNYNELFQLLWEAKEGKISKLQVTTHLISNGLSDNSILCLFNLLENEIPVNKMMSTFQIITKKNTEAANLARQALQDLKSFVHNTELLGVTFHIFVSPTLLYNVQQYSGMMCQLVCEIKKKHKQGLDVLAVGGRYDGMISTYKSMRVEANVSSKETSAVGISISLDKLVQAMEKEGEVEKLGNLDVVVCSLGSKLLLQEKSKVLRDLWLVGLRSCLIEARSIEDIQEKCNELAVSHCIILKDSEHGFARIRDRCQEKKYPVSEVADNMYRIIKSYSEGANDQLNQTLVRSESKTGPIEKNELNSNIIFKTGEKLVSNARKRYENQIRSQLIIDGVFKKIRGEVCILAIQLDNSVIKTIATLLEFASEYVFRQSVESIIKRHPRHKAYINEICEDIYEYRSKTNNCVIILYGLNEGSYKVLI